MHGIENNNPSNKSARTPGNIKTYLRGYDPVFVNWENVLDKLQDDENINKYVFNY